MLQVNIRLLQVNRRLLAQQTGLVGLTGSARGSLEGALPPAGRNLPGRPGATVPPHPHPPPPPHSISPVASCFSVLQRKRTAAPVDRSRYRGGGGGCKPSLFTNRPARRRVAAAAHRRTPRATAHSLARGCVTWCAAAAAQTAQRAPVRRSRAQAVCGGVRQRRAGRCVKGVRRRSRTDSPARRRRARAAACRPRARARHHPASRMSRSFTSKVCRRGRQHVRPHMPGGQPRGGQAPALRGRRSRRRGAAAGTARARALAYACGPGGTSTQW